MLAPKHLPGEYHKWNRDWAAPFGADWWCSLLEARYIGRFSYALSPGRLAWRYRAKLPKWLLRKVGPFGFQSNSKTRSYEYPWCYHATSLSPGMAALDIGSGAAGFQFVLSQEGLDVTSVDPMINPSSSIDWVMGVNDLRRLSRVFGGRVSFIQTFLEKSNLPGNIFDRAFAISVLEHLSVPQCISLLREVERVLKPGGYIVATVDLFLDCQPFAGTSRNQYGSNVDLYEIVSSTGLMLKIGKPSELFGFPEFDLDRITGHWTDYLCMDNTLSQCFVLEKPFLS